MTRSPRPEITLSASEAKAFYDRFGEKQDRQAFYEEAALGTLVSRGGFRAARSVFELGCGTGRLAASLLERELPPDARYRGTDVSETMIRLASERLAPFGARAAVTVASGEPEAPEADGSVDRFLSTYVLDLLPAPSARRALGEARRVLAPGGLLCLAGITHGTTPASRIVMGAWERLFALRPSWVGGCRPTELLRLVSPEEWDVRFHAVVVAWGIASEVLVAAPADPKRRELR